MYSLATSLLTLAFVIASAGRPGSQPGIDALHVPVDRAALLAVPAHHASQTARWQMPQAFPWQASDVVGAFAPDCAAQSLPTVAVDPGGTAYAVWIDWRDGSPALFWATQPDGGAWSANQAIPGTAGSVGTGDRPSLAVDAQGTLYLAWIDLRNGDRDVYFATRPAGGAWRAAERVNDDSAAVDQRHPSLAVDGSGAVVAVWQDPRNGDDDVYFAIRPAGAAWRANVRVNRESGTASQAKPDIAVDGMGNGYVAWSTSTTWGRVIEFAYRPHDGDWSAAVLVSGSGAGVFYDEPAIAVDSAGNAALAWHYRYMDRYTVVTAYRRAGASWSASYPEPFAFAPDVAMDAAGNAHVVFVGERNVNRIPHIYGAVIPPGGGAWVATQVSDGRFDAAFEPPAIAASPSGRQVAVWNAGEDAFTASRPAGGGWADSRSFVDEACSATPGRPGLAVDRAGSSYAVWQDGGNGRSRILFAFRPGAGGWQAPIQLGAAGSDDYRDPAIAVDASGTVTVVWSEWRDRGYDLYAAIRAPGGAWRAPVLVAGHASHWLRHPALAVDADGAVTAVWEEVAPDRPEATVLAAAIRPAGGAWSAAAEVPGGEGTAPSLAVDGLGTAFLVWQGRAQEIFFSSRPIEGAWAGRTIVDQGSAGAPVAAPAVAVDPGGGATVVWQAIPAGAGDWDIYARQRTPEGAWAAMVRVDGDTGTARQVAPTVAVDSLGRGYAVWTDDRRGDPGIASAYLPAGGLWARAARVDDDPGEAEQALPAVAVDPAGNATALWLDKRSGTWEVRSADARHGDLALPERRFLPRVLHE